MPKLRFQIPELGFQKPELGFQMPELRFQLPELRQFTPQKISYFSSVVGATKLSKIVNYWQTMLKNILIWISLRCKATFALKRTHVTTKDRM
jgi:hypothetical protein